MNPTNWIFLFSSLLPWACIVAMAFMTPRLTRPDLFFGVTVQPAFRSSHDGREILRGYDYVVLIFALLGLLPILCFKLGPAFLLPGLLGPAALEIIGCFWAFIAARRRALPHHVEPTLEREAQLTPRTGALPGGWLAQLGPFLLLAAVYLSLWINWARIPERVVIHWDAVGHPNGWANKNFFSVFGMAVTGTMICLLLSGICYAVTHGVRRINSSGQAGLREARFVRVISFSLLGIEYWIAVVMGLTSVAVLRPHPEAPLSAFWPILFGQALVVGIVLVSACITGQGGWRLNGGAKNENHNATASPVGDRTPDECWKLGLIYFNRNDPALFVEKRFGVGWTLNFANSKSWVFMGALLFFVVMSLSMALLMGRPTGR